MNTTTTILATTLVCAVLACLAQAAPPEGGSASKPRSIAPSYAYSRAQWEILFDDGISVEEYGRQLDFFKIELGVISKDGRVEYVSQVTRPKLVKRVGHVANDYRLHIGWKRGNLAAVDRRYLVRHGINNFGKELTHFFPDAVRQQLAELELNFAGREPAGIKRTRFQIRAKEDGSGYEFVVVEQDPV